MPATICRFFSFAAYFPNNMNEYIKGIKRDVMVAPQLASRSVYVL